MRPVKRVSAWVAALAGLCLLVLAARTGIFPVALAAIPGSLMLAGGVRSLLVPDLPSQQHIASGSLIGVLLALPLGLAGDGSLGVAALALSAAAFFAAGWLAIVLQPPLADVPSPPPSLSYSAQVALDDAVMNMMTLAAPPFIIDEVKEAVRESETVHALFTERGWIQEPASFHQTPPEIGAVQSSQVRIRGLDCEHLRIDSGYDLDPALPGRDRWLNYRENRTSHAWILRHPRPGPWLVCVHGFGMGNPTQDLAAFQARKLHERAGLNLAFVALPVHGPRAPGRRSGKEFVTVSPLNFVYAASQAMWDLRRMIGWIRTQEATHVGLYGISLGGYMVALLAGLENGLDCVIAGVPPSDLIATTERHSSALERRMSSDAGVSLERDRAVQRVVSPLALSPRLERDRRFIYAATGDRIVPVEQVRALWLHWDQPRICWSTGGHVTVLFKRAPRELVKEALTAYLGAAPPASG